MNFEVKGMICALAILATVASGCGKGSKKNPKIPGVDGPRVNYVDGKLTMSAVLENVTLDYGLRSPIPKLPNSWVEVSPDFQSNGYLVNITMDKEDVKTLTRGLANELDPMTLPGGRPLPGVSAGHLPAIAVEIPKLRDVVFYIGPGVLGTFIPAKLTVKEYIGTYRFYDGAGDQIGNISVVGQDSKGENSGVLVLINLKGKVGRIVEAPEAPAPASVNPPRP